MATPDSKTIAGDKERPSKKSFLGRLTSSKSDISQTYWAQEQSEDTGAVNYDTRMELLARHGNFSLAYSTAVQPLLKYFGDDNGYFAYRKRWASTFILGDAVAAQDQMEPLVDGLTANLGRLTFCQIHRPLAELLANRGYYVNEMGVDTTLTLSEYTFAGKTKEWLRYAANWTEKRGFRIFESQFDDVTPDEVEQVSEAWRKTRTVKRKEVRFLNRPIVLKNEPGVRKFFLRSPENQLLAFIFLDPIFEDGEVVGYVTSIKRRHPDAPLYAEHAIMKAIIEKLKKEQVRELRLGLSPMAWIEDNDFKHNRITSRLFRSGFESKWINGSFYNVVGHAEYKRRFRADEQKVYFASRSPFNAIRMLALIGLCGIA